MRRAARILVYGAVAALTLATAALWWAGDPRSLAWAVAELERAAQGRLAIRGATGSLLTGLRAQQVTFEDAGLNVVAERIELSWSPLHLIAGRLLVSRLHAARLTFDPGPRSDAPVVLPASLAPPLALEVAEASIGELAIVGERAPLRFDSLVLRLTGGARGWRLGYGRANTPWGPVAGRLALGPRPPFPVTGAGQWQASANGETVLVRAKLQGSLSELELEAGAAVKGGAVRARARLAPQEKNPVIQIVATARDFDPGRWLEGAPQAAVDGEIRLEGMADGGFSGRATLENRRPGTLDKGRIPLRSAAANVTAADDAVHLADLALDLGAAGRVTGQALWRDGALHLDGIAHTLDLRGVHGRLKATALSGTIAVEGDAASQRIRARLDEPGQGVEFDATVSGARITLAQARVRAGKSTLEGRGELGFGATRPFKFDGKLARFDPSRFGDYPAARIDADIVASGTLLPELRAEARFRIRDSRLLEHALRGEGRFVVSPRGVEQAEGKLLVAGNALLVAGGFGAPPQRLKWRIDAPRLANLDPRLAGRVQGSGYVGGTFRELEVGLELEAERLRLDRAHGIERAKAAVRIEPGENGAVSGEVTLGGYRGPALSVRSAALALRGTRREHAATLTASGEEIELAAELRGGWSEGRWQGTLVSFSNRRGPYEARLERAAPLAVSPGAFSLSEATFELPSGRIAIATLAKHESQLDARGTATGLPLAWLLERAGWRTGPFKTDLRLGAEWSLRLARSLNGSLKVWREGGAVVIEAQPPLAVDTQRFDIEARIVENRLALDVNIDAGRALRLAARARSELTRRGDRWGVAGSAPLSLSGTLHAESLEWAGSVAPLPGLSTAGALQAEFAANGTASAPALTGRVTGRGLSVLWPDHGFDLREGELDAAFKGDVLTLQRLVLRAGNGRLEASGTASLGSEPRLSVKASAREMQLISRPDRLLVASGDAALAFERGRVIASGKLRADRGVFELPAQTVTVSEDVVVLREHPAPRAPGARLPLRAELEFDFGPDFALRGRGLDARLGGVLRLVTTDERPLSVHGSVNVVRGTYRAYGQRLTIERGVLSFNGPLDNPRLDILALRKGLQVEAGLAVFGTLLHPRVRLISTPEVSDAEKLSWLALGHGLDRSSRGEVSVLARAASALLASDEATSLQSELAEAGGLDEVGIGGEGGLENTVVTLGKRLSSRVYVSYEQGVANATNAFKIHYELSRRWSVRAQTGTANALDLFYSLRFD